MAKDGKTTVVLGNWTFKRIDTLNWQVFERKEIERGERKGEVDWVGRSNYFGHLVDAVAFARNSEMDRKGDFESIDAYVDELRKVDAAFVRELRKAVG